MQDEIPGKKPKPPEQTQEDLLEYALLVVLITISAIFVMNRIDTGLHAVWLNVSHVLATAHLAAS